MAEQQPRESACPGFQAHDTLTARSVLRATLLASSALHVGAGKADEARSLSDMPVARSGQGEPYIPGSSFRGSFRSGLEALLRGLGLPVCDPLYHPRKEDVDLGDPTCACSARIAKARAAESAAITEARAFELAQEHSCPVCALFGNSFLAARLWVADLPAASPISTYTRDGVGIDRELGTAATNVLYSFEAVPSGSAFNLHLEVDNPQDHELGLLLVGLDLISAGLISLGGKKARGLGRVSVGADSLQLTTRQAADYFSGAEPTPRTDLAELRAAARRHYVPKSKTEEP
jgi:CRISPR-associated RAMP protein (TIGR02581 family)